MDSHSDSSSTLKNCGAKYCLKREMERGLILAIDEESEWLSIPESINATVNWKALISDPSFVASVSRTEKVIAKLCRALNSTWNKYHKSTLECDALTNKTSTLSKILVPKKKELPEPMNVLKDETTGFSDML